MRARCYLLSAFVILPLAARLVAAAAKENYKTHCTSCHGSDGKGQTRLGKKSGAKDLSDKAALAKLSDQEVFNTIKLGRKNAKGEEKMEAFGDDMSDAEITELVAYVRTLAK